MKHSYEIAMAVSVLALVSAGIVAQSGFLETDNRQEKETWVDQVEGEETEIATLAGGCFWCTEAIYENRPGIKRAVSGYAGGKEENANYDRVLTGETDHRESIRLEYYPSVISYREILDVYWKSIDPTDEGGQFTDRGPQYTTAIYYHSEKQRKIAEGTKENVSEKLEEPVATEVNNFTTFFRAEDYHQNYSQKNSVRYKTYKRGSGRKKILDNIWEDHPFN